jgi:type IV pilus assembly protein PilB
MAMVDPNDIFLVDELRFRTGMKIDPVLASESQIKEAIDKHFGTSAAQELKKSFR